LVIFAVGCASKVSPISSGPPRNLDAAIFSACETICLRPGDCATAFNDDGICPPGFLCARTFACARDAASD
jgi:hypothetical protein